jgi:L-rhamnose mutarotase
MQRLALCYRAIPEKKAEYITPIRNLAEITRGLKEAGCHEMTIFLRGNNRSSRPDRDIEEFNRIRPGPFHHKWNDWMNKLLEAPFDAAEPGAFAKMEEIWRFDAKELK